VTTALVLTKQLCITVLTGPSSIQYSFRNRCRQSGAIFRRVSVLRYPHSFYRSDSNVGKKSWGWPVGGDGSEWEVLNCVGVSLPLNCFSDVTEYNLFVTSLTQKFDLKWP
jgi:hypothetical protein